MSALPLPLRTRDHTKVYKFWAVPDRRCRVVNPHLALQEASPSVWSCSSLDLTLEVGKWTSIWLEPSSWLLTAHTAFGTM